MISNKSSKIISLFLPFFVVAMGLLLFYLYVPLQASNSTYTVNTTADSDDGTCNGANCTLREAINAANVSPDADTIVFSLPPNSTITLNGTQLPPITGTLTIDGSTAENLTISGDNDSRIFVIGQGPPAYPRPGDVQSANIVSTPVVTLTNLILTNGLENYGGGIINRGVLTIIDSTITDMDSYRGAIYSDNTLVISNTLFLENTINTGSAAGGAIYNENYGRVTIMASQFISNSVVGGTAIGGGAIYNASGTMTVTDSIFSGNSFLAGTNYDEGGGAIAQDFDSASRLYIANSTFRYNSSSYQGGAIRTSGSESIQIINSQFIGNTAESGGAIRSGSSSGNLSITGSQFSQNSALEGGGAILNSGMMTLTQSIFSGNSALEDGGAILNSGLMTLTRSIFSGNSALEDGGALYLTTNPIIMETTFINNAAGLTGGAIRYAVSGVGALLIKSTVYSNTADLGGGLYVNGRLNIANTTVSGNTADQGGGIYVFGNLTMNNSTLNNNTATTNGGGIFNDNVLQFSNNIIANSVGGDACVNNGNINTNVNNLIEDGSCSPLLTGDPLLGPLQDNGGSTMTHALLTGSPAIDAGNASTCTTTFVNNEDQRGETRPQDGDGDGVPVCDIGAYEVESIFGVSKTGPALAAAGEPITYTLRVVNNLPLTLTNLVLTDTVPTNANYVSGGTLNSGVVSWMIPELTSGSSLTRTFVVTAVQTIINDDYRVSASGGYSTTGLTAVATQVFVPITGLSASNNGPTELGQSTSLMANINSGTGVNFTWDFGDGSSGIGSSPSHVYPDVGQYTAVVTASNLLGQFSDTTLVTILDIPISGLSATNNGPTTLGDPTTLTAFISAGTNVSYQWAFGDGTTGSGQETTHTYSEAGQFTAVVTATNSVGELSATTAVTITIDEYVIYMPSVHHSAGNTKNPLSAEQFVGKSASKQASLVICPLLSCPLKFPDEPRNHSTPAPTGPKARLARPLSEP